MNTTGSRRSSAARVGLVAALMLVANVGVFRGATTNAYDWLVTNGLEVTRRALAPSLPEEVEKQRVDWHLIVRMFGKREEMIEVTLANGVARARHVEVEEGGVTKQLEALLGQRGALSIDEAAAGVRVTQTNSACPALTKLASQFETERFRVIPAPISIMDSIRVEIEIRQGIQYALTATIASADMRVSGHDYNPLLARIGKFYRTILTCETGGR